MHGRTTIFWANLRPCSLQSLAARLRPFDARWALLRYDTAVALAALPAELPVMLMQVMIYNPYLLLCFTMIGTGYNTNS